MKLEGSLDAFSLPDIFQLLSYTKKTGGLRLAHAGARGVVYFTDGAVTGAAAEGGRQTLARRLVGAGLLDDATVAAAVDDATTRGETASGGGVVAALLRSGALSADTVAPVAFEQVHDAVFELLRWPSGDFTLAVDETNPDDVGLRLAPDEVVTRAAEQRVRWDAAAAVVPSPEAVPVLCASPDPELVIRAADWSVLRLVDGRRRVAEIVDLAGGGQFGTVVTLADLVARGLVQVRSADTSDVVADLGRRLALLAPAERAAAEGAAAPAAAEPVASSPVAQPLVVEPPAAVTREPVVGLEASPVAEPVASAALPSLAAEETGALPAPVPAANFAPAASTVVTVADPAAADPGAADPGAIEHAVPGPSATQSRLGGAHVPGDVVPPRVEPFIGSRRPAFAESPGSAPRVAAAVSRGVGAGASALATAPASDALIERDPSVNRSLLLRLIAGVRGL